MLSKEEFNIIQKISCLEMPEDEAQVLREELEAFSKSFDLSIGQMDLSEVKEPIKEGLSYNDLRKDTDIASYDSEELLHLSAYRKGSYIQIPRGKQAKK